MNNKKIFNISTEILDYYLPNCYIARNPLIKRDDSKLLVYKDSCIEESIFNCISNFIPENTFLVFNNTQVVQSRLLFRKNTGTIIEIFCIEPKHPSDYILSFKQRNSCIWFCLIGNAKRWKNDILSYCLNTTTILTAKKLKQLSGGGYLVQFVWNNPNLTFANILEYYGHLPLPPYLKRQAEEQDKKKYQTIYAKNKGSVAAPTAGLHFTNDVFCSLKKKNILIDYLTLHIGWGTFQSIKSETITNHKMHVEYFFIKKQTIEYLLRKMGQIFAVGTTSARAIESLYYIGLILNKKFNVYVDEIIYVSQWMPYFVNNTYFSPEQALKNILEYMNKKKINVLKGATQLLITAGYKFKIMNGIITNFHQPRSTLLLLIAAFIGVEWRKIYYYALHNNFRFLSYGDCSLLIP